MQSCCAPRTGRYHACMRVDCNNLRHHDCTHGKQHAHSKSNSFTTYRLKHRQESEHFTNGRPLHAAVDARRGVESFGRREDHQGRRRYTQTARKTFACPTCWQGVRTCIRLHIAYVASVRDAQIWARGYRLDALTHSTPWGAISYSWLLDDAAGYWTGVVTGRAILVVS